MSSPNQESHDDLQERIRVQQKRIIEIEDIRESLCKLNIERRTKEKFESSWNKIQHIFSHFQKDHRIIAADSAAVNTAYIVDNKVELGQSAFDRAREFINKTHPNVVSEISTLQTDGDQGNTSGAGLSLPLPVPRTETASSPVDKEIDKIFENISQYADKISGVQRPPAPIDSFSERHVQFERPKEAMEETYRTRLMATSRGNTSSSFKPITDERESHLVNRSEPTDRYQATEREHYIPQCEPLNYRRESTAFHRPSDHDTNYIRTRNSASPHQRNQYADDDWSQTRYYGNGERRDIFSRRDLPSFVERRHEMDHDWPERSQYRNEGNRGRRECDRPMEYMRRDQERSFSPQRMRQDAYPINQYRPYRNRPSPPVPEIPKFDGDIRQFDSFRSIFESVYADSDVGTTERLIMLQSKLMGDAKRVIEHLGVDGHNYFHAWDLLNRRYSSRRALIEREIQTLIEIPPITHKDAKSVGKALDVMRSVIQNSRKIGFEARDGIPFIPFFITRLMDTTTRREFDMSLRNPRIPATIDDIDYFLENRYIIMTPTEGFDPLTQLRQNLKTKEEHNGEKSRRRVNENTFLAQDAASNFNKKENKDSASDVDKKNKCFICAEQHYTSKCPKLLDSEDKESLLRHYKICIYCLGHKYHYKFPCRKRDQLKCNICNDKHITIMHPVKKQEGISQSHHCENATPNSESATILPTAVAKFVATDNRVVAVRCLLDQGSQSCYIAEDLVQKLRLKKKRTNVIISGLGGISSEKASSVVLLKMKIGVEEIIMKALVVPKVTRSLPNVPSYVKRLANQKSLADPTFEYPAPILVLLGSNITPKLFMEGVEIIEGYLFQKTRLGWIVSGPADNPTEKFTSSHVSLAEMELHLAEMERSLIEFWDKPVTKEDIDVIEEETCEKLFLEKHFRTPDGRYVVPIPWRKDAPRLGNSYTKAVQLYIGQEKRWEKNPTHKQLSDEFMEEYLKLNHMAKVPKHMQSDTSSNSYYIPYHSILRQNALTSKLRNVFNASSSTSNGITLNQTIHVGPKLQTHICDILTRIRQFKYVFTSDITKMYRQILLPEKDQLKLRILWRKSISEPISEFYLKTITYGMDCAPWQAIRTLHQIADDNAPDNETKWIIKNAFYMDDCCYGAQTIGAAQKLIQNIVSTLEKGKLPLTKWSSNEPEVLAQIDKELHIDSYVDLQKSKGEIKTLGLHFNPEEDCFFFHIKQPKEIKYTKRGLLSVTASIYDTQGFLLPCIMKMRMEIQNLWQQNLGWDDEIGPESRKCFERIISTLTTLNTLRFPRWTGNDDPKKITELIGFSDASGNGYAAVIYSRVETNDGYTVRLIAAKGRVTPLKTKTNANLTTIPKMELESILLLANLYSEVKQSLGDIPLKFTAYTDSEVALCWVRSSKDLENKYVARRVNQIKKILKPGDIHHVRTADNPSDCISRGVYPDALIKHPLWFTGPAFLQGELPYTPFRQKLEETVAHVTVDDSTDDNCTNCDYVNRFSSYSKMINTIARCIRWKTKVKGPLSVEELQHAEEAVIRKVQQTLYKKQLALISKGQPVELRHMLSTLDPFIDPESGILRAGGRIERSTLPYHKKHPIILGKSHLTDLIIKKAHEENQHCGNSLTSTIIRERYYIPALRQQVKKHIRTCVKCIKMRANTIQPIMAPLLKERLEISYVFQSTGIDLCGPFWIKESRARSSKPVKVYIAVFVCMATKAIHCEIVSDLSTNAFLSAFNRFISRRGSPDVVRSDNGTNLAGASRVLKDAWEQLTANCEEEFAYKQIKWLHNPPRASHFGGLFEAAVGSLKRYIKKLPSTSNLVYEEFHTAVCGWEAILNSRPLYPVSDDIDDLNILTPSHFLIQRNLLSPPMGKGMKEDLPATKRWLQVQELQLQFWKKFENDYLQSLQKRYRWKRHGQNVQVGDLVIIKEIATSPLTWKTGRVTDTMSDIHGVIRQVKLKTANRSDVYRAVHQLVPLLPEDKENQVMSDGNPQPENEVIEVPRESEQYNRFNPRKSKRVRLPTQSLFTIFCTLLLLTFSDAFQINPINKTTTMVMRGVQIKALELNFSIVTSVNVTKEMEIVDQQLEEFIKFCKSENSPGKIKEHCTNYQTMLQTEVEIMKSRIRSEFARKRTKRAPVMPLLASLGGNALRMGAKYLPEIALTGAVTYLGYENNKLATEISSLQSKSTKIAALMLNISEVQYHHVEQQLDAVIYQQQEIRLQQRITDFATGIQALIEEISARHKQLNYLVPIKELKKFVASINEKIPNVILPYTETEADIFRIRPCKKELQDGQITITYVIPLVNAEQYYELVVISAPNNAGKVFIFENQQPVQRLVMDNDKSKYFFMEDSREILPNVFDEVTMLKTPKCVTKLARQDSDFKQWCESTKLITESLFFRLSENRGIIFKGSETEVVLKYNNSQVVIPYPVTVIDFTGGIMDTADFELAGTEQIKGNISFSDIPKLQPTTNLTPPEIKIATVNPDDTTLNQLKRDLTDELYGHPFDGLEAHHLITGATIGVIAIAITIGIILGWCRSKQTQPTTFISHLSPEDRQIGSWVASI